MRNFIDLLENSDIEPTVEEIQQVIDELDSEGDISIGITGGTLGMQRSWKRSYVLHKMLGEKDWERFVMGEVAKLRERPDAPWAYKDAE